MFCDRRPQATQPRPSARPAPHATAACLRALYRRQDLCRDNLRMASENQALTENLESAEDNLADAADAVRDVIVHGLQCVPVGERAPAPPPAQVTSPESKERVRADLSGVDGCTRGCLGSNKHAQRGVTQLRRN